MLIERAKLLSDLYGLLEAENPDNLEATGRILERIQLVQAQPSVDAVPVTRCKDCRYCINPYWAETHKWCTYHRDYTSENRFCGWAEPGSSKEDLGKQVEVTARSRLPFPLNGMHPSKITIGERMYDKLMPISSVPLIIDAIAPHGSKGTVYGIPFEVDYFVDPDLFRIDYKEG